MKKPARSLILIVDNLPASARWTSDLLADEHDFIFATSGSEALDLARAAKPDLIVLDSDISHLDGYQVCKALQCCPSSAAIPVMFLSTLSAPEHEERALEYGALDFLVKPVHPDILRARVRTRLASKHKSDILRDLAMVDALTGVGNRRAFDAAMHKEWIRCSHGAAPMALILIDVDRFKRFNDTLGHLAGDRCLKKLTRAMQRAIRRPEDQLCRYGGEEFAILLPGQNSAGARVIADRIKGEIAHLKIDHPLSDASPIVTVSMGVAAMYPSEHHATAQLVQLADTLLYKAKIGGRNQYFVAELARSEALITTGGDAPPVLRAATV